jgi:hypothetical protein
MMSNNYYTNNNISKSNSDLVISLLTAAAQSFKYASAANASYPSSANYPIKLGKDSDGNVWLRAFLINSRKNAAGWSVSPETIHQNVLSIEGKPFVLERHPVSGKITTRLGVKQNLLKLISKTRRPRP